MVVGHENIKSATSIIDYIFRMLGYDYLNRTDLVHVITQQKVVTNNPQMRDTDVNPDASNIYQPITEKQTQNTATATVKGQTFDLSMGAQSDAPACSNCRHTTIRSGTCYKCLNCGTSMGCS